jgi:hypothetical protein
VRGRGRLFGAAALARDKTLRQMSSKMNGLFRNAVVEMALDLYACPGIIRASVFRNAADSCRKRALPETACKGHEKSASAS